MSRYYPTCQYCRRRKHNPLTNGGSFRQYLDRIWEAKHSKNEKDLDWSVRSDHNPKINTRHLIEDVFVYHREIDSDDDINDIQRGSLIQYHHFRRKIPFYSWSD